MQRVVIVIVVAGIVAASVGALQLSHGLSLTAPPDCARGEYNYGQACLGVCDWEFFKRCLQVGGTVACCYNYGSEQWECQCIEQ